MTAINRERDTRRRADDGEGRPCLNFPVNGGDNIWQGTLACLNATEGMLVPAVTATGLLCVGRAEWNSNATGLLDGALRNEVREGTFRWSNSAAADLIEADDVGKPCFLVDNQTVALTSGTNTRSPAGIIRGVDSQGVWVESSIAISRQLLNDASADAT